MRRLAATAFFFAAVVAGPASASTSEVDVLERFLTASRATREHRADMLTRFAQEGTPLVEDKTKGLRIYLRWAPSNRERLRNLALTLESDGLRSEESISVREEGDWGLVWYSALVSRPKGEMGVLRVKADVESTRFRTPFQSVREVKVFEGSLPIMLPREATPIRMVVELDSDSPFAERRQASRALKLSLVPDHDSKNSMGAR